MRLKQRLGVVFLALVLVIGGILIAVVAAIAVLTFSNLNSNQSTRFSAEALAVAKAGALDGLMRVVYDKNFSTGNPGCFSVPVNSRSALVQVIKDVPATGQTSIYSQATISKRTRILFSLLNVNSVTGEVNLISTAESTTTVDCGA